MQTPSIPSRGLAMRPFKDQVPSCSEPEAALNVALNSECQGSDTIWCRYPEMYLLDGAPVAASACNKVLTRGSDEVELIGASGRILNELATLPEWQHTQVAYVSRTTEPAWAKTCLQLLKSTADMSLDEQGALQVWCPSASGSHRTAATRAAHFEARVCYALALIPNKQPCPSSECCGELCNSPSHAHIDLYLGLSCLACGLWPVIPAVPRHLWVLELVQLLQACCLASYLPG